MPSPAITWWRLFKTSWASYLAGLRVEADGTEARLALKWTLLLVGSRVKFNWVEDEKGLLCTEMKRYFTPNAAFYKLSIKPANW